MSWLAGGASWRSAFRRSAPRQRFDRLPTPLPDLRPFPYAAETDEKIVALSFDDGPNEPYYNSATEHLDRYDVKATFFQVGRCALRFPSSTRRVVESGHVLSATTATATRSRAISRSRGRRSRSVIPRGVLFDHPA